MALQNPPPGDTRTAAKKTAARKPAGNGTLAQQILDYAVRFIGVPYKWGGTSPDGFDCSGLIQYAYNHFGLNLPRVADAQARVGKAVSAKDARPGDLVYFENNAAEAGYDHIGIYLGHGMMLAAPHTGAQVRIQPVGAAAGFDRVLPQTAYSSLKGNGGNFHYQLPDGRSVGEAQMGVTGDAASSGGGGRNAGGDPALDPSKPMNVHDYLSLAGEQFGYLAAFLDNKELGPIIAKAAKNGWSQDRMLNALEKTRWWKHTASTARQWQAMKQLDPASARLELKQKRQEIQQLAHSTLGHTLDEQRADHMANTAIAAGWSSAQLQKAIGHEFKYHGAKRTYEGAAGQTLTQLQEIARQYVVPLGHDALQHWTRQILKGTYTTADFTAYAQQQAESLYPTLKAPLKAGQTVRQWADPYMQLASQILERPADQFNLADPKWNKALLQPQPDGERKAMLLSDWADYLRSTPEYKQTDQAKAATADFGLALANQFGKVNAPGGQFGSTAIRFGG